MWTVERFWTPTRKSPVFRLRSDTRVSWCKDGFTHGCYILKRDALARAKVLNEAAAVRHP